MSRNSLTLSGNSSIPILTLTPEILSIILSRSDISMYSMSFQLPLIFDRKVSKRTSALPRALLSIFSPLDGTFRKKFKPFILIRFFPPSPIARTTPSLSTTTPPPESITANGSLETMSTSNLSGIILLTSAFRSWGKSFLIRVRT